MSNITWLGLSGDMNSVANYSGGALPIANDKLFFTEDHINPPTSNMDTLAAVDLDLIYIGKNFTGNIGSSGNPLEVSADKVIHEGSGTLYYLDGDETTDWMVIDSAAPGTAAVIAGTITRINVIRGLVNGTSALTGVSVLSVAPNGRVLIDASAGTIALVLLDGGEGICSAVVTLLEMSRGTWTQEIEEVVTAYVNGGSLYYNPPATTGTMTLGVVSAHGVLDLQRNTEVKTITTLMAEPGAQVKYHTDFTTITNDYNISRYFSPHAGMPGAPSGM